MIAVKMGFGVGYEAEAAAKQALSILERALPAGHQLCDWERLLLSRQKAAMNVLKKYWGISLTSLAAVVFLFGILYPGSAAGEFARGVFASGEFAAGIFAAGTFAVGVFSIGVFSIGTFAAGIFAAGSFAVGVFSIGIFSIGIFSVGLFSVGLYGVGLFVLAKYRKSLQIATAAGESDSEGQAGGN